MAYGLKASSWHPLIHLIIPKILFYESINILYLYKLMFGSFLILTQADLNFVQKIVDFYV